MSKSIAPKTRKENKLPDITDAEKWLDPFRFVYKGKTYIVEPDCTVHKESDKEVKEG